jgi:ParB-like nuclease domain
MSPDTMAGLTASLKRFGVVEPIIWNQRSGYVVGGHQRLTVLQTEGAEKAQVIVVDLPDKDEKELNIALNNLQGEWDYTALKTILADIQPDETARVMLGFSEQELGALLQWGEEMAAPPAAAVGETPEDKLAAYENNTIKQIVLYFPTEEYVAVLQKMKDIAEGQEPKLDTNSDVFLFLLNFYGAHSRQEKKPGPERVHLPSRKGR